MFLWQLPDNFGLNIYLHRNWKRLSLALRVLLTETNSPYVKVIPAVYERMTKLAAHETTDVIVYGLSSVSRYCFNK